MTSQKLEAEFDECFEMYDEEGEGELPVSGLNQMMGLLGWNPMQSDIDEVVRKCKLKASGKMGKPQFIALMKIWASEHEKDDEEALKNAFQVLDKDGSGYIEWDELKYVMQGAGEPLTDDECVLMMKEADKDGDGKIDYQEFVMMMRGDCEIL